MNKKWLPWIFLVIMIAAILLIRRYRDDTGTEKDPSSKKLVNRDRGFDRRSSFIEYTRHAQCRMKCRQISRAEVEDIMNDGKINYRKSNVNQRPCPVYALEGNTDDGQQVRIVFAQCDRKTKVVTVIDLEKEWACNCEGDENITSLLYKTKPE